MPAPVAGLKKNPKIDSFDWSVIESFDNIDLYFTSSMMIVSITFILGYVRNSLLSCLLHWIFFLNSLFFL